MCIRDSHCGGIQGGITNGNAIVIHLIVRPPASIKKEQISLNFDTDELEKRKITGSHDLAFILRLPPIIEAVSLLAIADLYLYSKIYS